MERLVFIGPGRVGLALGSALVQAEAVSSLLYQGRRPEPPSHPLFIQGRAEYLYGLALPPEGTTAVLLTVPDRVLAEVSMALAGRGAPPPGCPVLHTAGVQGSEPLEPLHRVGYQVGTLHPLQAVANPITSAERLRGAGYAISGERGALAAARRLVTALEGTPLTVPTARRPLYHAAAVLASNYMVTLLGESVRLLGGTGVDPDDARRVLVALARGSLANVGELGLESALTGPVVRGDVETVHLHLRTLEPRDAALYAVLGRRTLERVRRELSPETAGELDELFHQYERGE